MHRLRAFVVVVLLVVAACTDGVADYPDPTLTASPRPAARTACERALAEMAYTDNRTGNAWNALQSAAFQACSFDEFAAANSRFLRTGRGENTAVFYLPSGSERRFYEFFCEGKPEYEGTKLCQTLAEETAGQ
jgi:hypothetical protein